MDVQTATAPGVIGSKFGFAQEGTRPEKKPEEEKTDILFLKPLIYLHLAVLQKMLGTS
jgi:hypothetical protein